jgi:hypothetical protein
MDPWYICAGSTPLFAVGLLGQEMLGSADAQLYRGMVYLAGIKLNPSRFASAERFESQQAKKIDP